MTGFLVSFKLTKSSMVLEYSYWAAASAPPNNLQKTKSQSLRML